MDTQNSTWTFLQTFTPQFQALGSEIDRTLRATSAPKSKFAFKRKTGATSAPAAPKPGLASEPLEPSAVPNPPSTSSSNSGPSNLILSSRSRQYLTRSDLSEHPQQTDLSLSDLESCVVNLLPPTAEDAAEGHIKISALHARNLTNCVLLLPEVEGSALLHDMFNCVVVLGCHQFRMHSSKNIDVLLSISSTPIIEDCTSIRFGHYPPSFHPSPLHSEPQPLSIQDFSHIRPTPSPNYSSMNEERQGSLHRAVEALRDSSAWVDPRSVLQEA
ncbi:tubulin binding cofactor C-domain-containing protein [Pholiota molesta]|nr:tubulin binding cofactor C-domain-containing protein [Pholiota molesta]